MPTCIIQSCPYWKFRKSRHPDITLHSFPGSAWHIRTWLEKTGHRFKDIDAFSRRILEAGKDGDYRICSAHFANDSYTLLGGTRVLKVDAMPTIFPAGSKLIHKGFCLRRTRKERLVCRRPPKPNSTSAKMAPALTKSDVATQTQDSPSTTHRGVQTEEWFTLEDHQDRSLPAKPVTQSNDEYCQRKDMAWNDGPADEGWRHMAKKILNLTLEIIYLLTGERPQCGGGDRSQNPPMKSPTPFQTIERIAKQKILEVTKKMIELLTGEVPIRCQDVTVYFSMEEWEYLEGHKDLYKDVMMASQPAFTSPGWFQAENSARSSKHFSALNDKNKGWRLRTSQCGNPPRTMGTFHSWDPSACVKEEISSAEALLPCSEISITTGLLQIPSFHVKEEVLQADERLPKTTLHAQPTTFHTKERHHSVKDWLPKSSISTPTYHTQPTSIHVKEGPLSDEEHLLNSKISRPTQHGQCTTIHVKKGSLSDEEHLLNAKISRPTQHGQCTTIHVKKGSLSDEEHLNAKISRPTQHGQCTTIHVKKESRSDEEHFLNSKISPPVHNTQPTTIYTREGTLSEVGHLPNFKISPPTHHRQPRTIHIKEGPMSDEEHSLKSKNSTPIHQTEPKTIQIKEEELLPHEMDYTTVIVEGDSISSNEECPPNSSNSISPGRHTLPHASKGHPSSEDEHAKYSNLYLPSSPIQYIPVRINEDFLVRQHLQHRDIPTHHTEDLAKEEPILYEDGLYADSSAPECDENLSMIPINFLPSGNQRTFPSDPDFSERSLFCPECGRSFTDKARVEAHLRSHWGEKPYCCSVCLKSFRSRSKLVIHQLMHSGEKPYACSECGKRFAQNAYLQRHIRGHTGEKPFPCSICGKCFACRSDMVKHEFTHTGARPHLCALCGKRFTKKSHLNRHMRIHTGEKPFCCPDCGRSFGCNSDMVSHQRIHQGIKPFSCSECGKRFLRKQDAQRHQTIHR